MCDLAHGQANTALPKVIRETARTGSERIGHGDLLIGVADPDEIL